MVTIAHVSHPAALEVLAAEQRAGSPAVAETCPQYLMLSEAEIHREGALRKFTPPARIRSAHDRNAMWAAFNTAGVGGIHHLSTDHAPSTVEHKRSGGIWDAPFGLPGLDTTLPVMVDAALRSETSLETIVARYAAAPARRYGLGGKGRLRPGCDADLVVVDPAAAIGPGQLTIHSKAGWSPYADRPLRGRITATVLRGKIIAVDGAPQADPAGRFLPGAGYRNP